MARLVGGLGLGLGLVASVSLALSACATGAPPHTAVVAPSSGMAQAPPTDPRHRQYFDQRRRRFYYFDPVQKRYFWENGQAKT